jgi:hypothetical protein
VQPEVLRGLLAAARLHFPDLELTAPSGVLSVAAPPGPIEQIRIEAGPAGVLRLQSVGLVAADRSDVSRRASVEVSGAASAGGRRGDARQLLDFDNPTGPGVQTPPDDQGWCEVTLRRPTELTRILVRNVAARTAAQNWGLRVLARSGGEWAVVYDHAARTAELDRFLQQLPRHRDLDPETTAVLPVLPLVVAGSYASARQAFDAAALSPESRRMFRSVVTEDLLVPRSLEWTVHGPQRCFRFWAEQEKRDYVQFAADVAQALAGLTPHVCFGFGAALCVVRDGDLIPHDDDLDIIIGFDPDEAANLPAGLKRVEDHLRPLGYTVSGNFSAHRHVRLGSGKHVDVFVGLFEGDTISWYPGTRGALDRQTMFPVSEGSLLGVPCRLPRSPLRYLEVLYGPGWRTPDPGFQHTWDRSAYADLVSRGTIPKAVSST